MEGGYERGAGGQAWPLKAITLLTLCVGAKNVEVSDGEQGMGRLGRGLQEVMRRRLQVFGAGLRQ